MSSWEVAAVAGGFVVAAAITVVLVRLVVAVTSLDRTAGELARAIDDVRRETVLLGDGGGAAGPVGAAVSSNGDAETQGATTVSDRANGRVRPFDLGLVGPVIKARALGRGTSQAARQLRQRRER